MLLADINNYPSNIFYLIQYILAFSAVGLYFYFGIKNIKRSIKTENDVQKSFLRGFGLFTLSAGLSIMLFFFDRVVIFVTGNRLFPAYSQDFSYFSRDYFWVIFGFLLIGATFLIRPVEKYLLNKPKMVLSKLTLASWAILPFMRLIETYLGKDIGLIFWCILLFFILINFVILVVSYLKLGSNAPKGSKLKKKSQSMVFGLIFWLSGGFLSDSLAKESFDAFGFTDVHLLAPLGGILLLISLGLLIYGFQRDY